MSLLCDPGYGLEEKKGEVNGMKTLPKISIIPGTWYISPSTAKNVFLIPSLEVTRPFRRPRRHPHLLSRRVRVTRPSRARNATLLS